MRMALEQLFASYGQNDVLVAVLVTTDFEMKRLNAEFRGVREATDVLTFPGPDWEGAPLGDIAISMDFAIKGSKARRVTVQQELCYLAIHGGLHLLGYDDQTEEDRADMIARMNEIALKVDLTPDNNWASQPH